MRFTFKPSPNGRRRGLKRTSSAGSFPLEKTRSLRFPLHHPMIPLVLTRSWSLVRLPQVPEEHATQRSLCHQHGLASNNSQQQILLPSHWDPMPSVRISLSFGIPPPSHPKPPSVLGAEPPFESGRRCRTAGRPPSSPRRLIFHRCSSLSQSWHDREQGYVPWGIPVPDSFSLVKTVGSASRDKHKEGNRDRREASSPHHDDAHRSCY